MLRKSKTRKVRRFYRKKGKKKSSKVLEISIIFLTLLLLIYGLSFLKKISESGEPPRLTKDDELILVRIQILNGAQNEGLSQKLADRLKELKVNNIVYDVIQIGDSEYLRPEQSFILDRTVPKEEADPSEIALLTAEALRIDQENVLGKKLKNNYEDIALTIVIGEDYPHLLE